jgi:hypothetical protein
MEVWEARDYRHYLSEKLDAEGNRSGLRKALASAIQVHTSYVSNVLKGIADFSLEQGEAINTFFAHTEDEGEFFLLLVSRDRAGTQKLKRRFESRIQKLRDERSNISKRLKIDNTISEKDRELFYSSAMYGAIHVLTSIPGYGTVEKISQTLHLPKSRVAEAVEFLLRIGVLLRDGDSFAPGSRHVHLGNDSALILKHHSNWRLHTLSALQFVDKDDLHYSAAISLSHEGAFKVKEALLEALNKTVGIVKESEVETAFVLNFDFYKLIT